jgi:hypothetical protein
MINEKLHRYYSRRCFRTSDELGQFLARAFHRRKTLYFDEVENANVWSFYLVDRDLHHTFEEYVLGRGLPAYATWSRLGREEAKDDIGRATFPISEASALYRKPVPRAGEAVDYVLEVLELDSNSAVLGFLGFLVGVDGQRSLRPSVTAAWLRVFVQYSGDEREVASFPPSFEETLRGDLATDAWL